MDQSPFAKLAPEIRNQIWELAVTASGRIDVDRGGAAAPPPITRACRQARHETVRMFYVRNKFHFSTAGKWPYASYEHDNVKPPSPLSKWLHLTGQECHDSIKDLTVSKRMLGPDRGHRAPLGLRCKGFWVALRTELEMFGYGEQRRTVYVDTVARPDALQKWCAPIIDSFSEIGWKVTVRRGCVVVAG